ncbi:MAG: phage gp6-like head-tail connector protein [Planctomycetes bacterium]|nr:phage gp6-like head-tail connector protein [Planctomycetota bacterium]
MADPTPKICTLADVKLRLGITDTDYDSLLSRIIVGVESMFDSHTCRTLIAPAADVTEYYTGQGRFLALKAHPVVAITSIKISYAYDFDSETALVVNTDYRLINGGANGIIYRITGHWPELVDGIQAVYRGGYCAVDVVPEEGEHALPDDLREVAIEQATFIFKRRDDIGLSAVGFDGGSMQKFSAMKLMPMVLDVLKKYERVSL